MAIAFRSLNYTRSATSPATVARPANLAAGDLMLMFVTTRIAGGTTITPPADFTMLQADTLPTMWAWYVGYKIATTADTTTDTWPVSWSPDGTGGIVLAAFSGVTSSTPIVGSGVDAIADTPETNPTFTPGIATLSTDDMLVFHADHGWAGTTSLSNWRTATQNPASWTEDLDERTASNTVGLAHGLTSGIGATGAWTVTSTDSDMNCITAVVISNGEGGGEEDVVGIDASGSIAITGSADLIGFFPVVGMDADGTIELAGAADLTGLFAVVDIAADGGISLSGSASLPSTTSDQACAIGGVTIGGYAEGDAKIMPEAIGGVTIGGYAEGTDALPKDYPVAFGGVSITPAIRHGSGWMGGYARGSKVGAPELPPTDDIGWIPSVTPPALPKLTFSGVSLTGASAVIGCDIELSDHGGMMSATISTAVLGGGSKPALFTVVRVKYGGFSLFEGRVEHVTKNVGDTAGWTITCAGPMVVLRDHKSYRTVFVDSDLQNWQTDQGPRTSPDTFEVASRSTEAAT